MVYAISCLLIKIELTHEFYNEYTKMSIDKKFAGNSEFTAKFFDESCKAWMANKRRKGESMVYVCAATCLSGKACVNSVVSTTEFCRIHTRSDKGKGNLVK